MPLVANNVDPTRTTVLRAQHRRFFAVTWREVAQEIERRMALLPASGQTQQMQEFQRIAREVVYETMGRARNDPHRGLATMLQAAYLRGLRQAERDAADMDMELGVQVSPVIYQQDHQTELALLLLLLSSDLDSIVEAVIAAMVTAFADSVRAGEPLSKALSNVRKTVDKVGSKRTAAMTATAIVGAFAAAQLARYAQLGIRSVGAVPEFQWVTAEKPCPRCARLAAADNGRGRGIYTLEQARGLIPVHPFCRCRWSPVGI